MKSWHFPFRCTNKWTDSEKIDFIGNEVGIGRRCSVRHNQMYSESRNGSSSFHRENICECCYRKEMNTLAIFSFPNRVSTQLSNYNALIFPSKTCWLRSSFCFCFSMSMLKALLDFLFTKCSQVWNWQNHPDNFNRKECLHWSEFLIGENHADISKGWEGSSVFDWLLTGSDPFKEFKLSIIPFLIGIQIDIFCFRSKRSPAR